MHVLCIANITEGVHRRLCVLGSGTGRREFQLRRALYKLSYPPPMSSTSTEALHSWLRSPLGERLYALERKLAAEALAQVFGWQLLQIGLWGDDDALITEARTQRKSVLGWHGARNPQDAAPTAMIRSRTDSLAVASDSIDAVLLPHTLEYEPDPHEILREVERILSGEGHLIVFGFGHSRVGGCDICLPGMDFLRASNG